MASHLEILNQGIDAWQRWRKANPDIPPDLKDADLRGIDLSFADLRAANLTGCNLTGVSLRQAMLRDADLSDVTGLQSEQLAGADLAGAKLPDSLGSLFKDVEFAKGVSDNAQKLFVAMLAACLYSWLTIATTTDVSLITNRASSPLPIIQTSIPIVGFYMVTPLLLTGVFLYFHFYLQKLWDELGCLPAIFPDGKPLQAKSDPWLLGDMVRAHVSKLSANRPFLSYLQQWVSILLAWWFVPITLGLFWLRYLPRHDFLGTAFHSLLTAVCVTAAVFLYKLARATLRGAERRPFVWKSAIRTRAAYKPIALTLISIFALLGLSVGALYGVRTGSSDADWWPNASGARTWVSRAMAHVGYSPFADLRASDLSVKPANWTGKNDNELDSVRGLQLAGVDLRYADIRGAFLPVTVLNDAHLEWADLLLADLRRSELSGAHLYRADLLGAQLKGADLLGADLRDADLTAADLTEADLTSAEVKYADFTAAVGLTADQVRKAKDWQDALYDPALLLELQLPLDNNQHVTRLLQGEPGTARNAAESVRLAQLARLMPGNIAVSLILPRLIRKSVGGATEVGTVEVASSGGDSRTASFSVSDLARLYNFPTGVTGHGQIIGIIELGGGYRDADLNKYFSTAGLPRPSVTSVSVDGAKNTSRGDPNSADGQVELDIEAAGATAPGAQIVVYFAPDTNEGYADAIAAAAHDTVHKPSILLIDWGSTEKNWTPQALRAVNDALKFAATSGITVVVPSGDGGASDGVSDGKPHVNFPASSPWVLAIGGTELRASGSSIVSETVWNNGDQGGATGGGVSDIFPRPDWQSQVSVPQSPDGQPGRGIPDVAANASPLTGLRVLVDGQVIVIGGTSATAPLWAGLIALINEGLGRNVGYINPVLYQKIGPGGAFRDIQKGTNGNSKLKGCSAGPGWDACTGWGTPDGKKLLDALKSL
jgi:uncharacterized protein YjbI with pentapeptide repeats